MRTEQALDAAHRIASRAMGQLVLVIVSRRGLTRRLCADWARALREAANMLDRVARGETE